MLSFISCSSGGEVSIQQLDSPGARIEVCFKDRLFCVSALLDFLVGSGIFVQKIIQIMFTKKK